VDVFTPPNYFVKADIRSILSDGTILEQNLTPEEYSRATQHEVSIIKVNYKTNKIEETYQNETSINLDTREDAVKLAIEILNLDIRKGRKWQ